MPKRDSLRDSFVDKSGRPLNESSIELNNRGLLDIEEVLESAERERLAEKLHHQDS